MSWAPVTGRMRVDPDPRAGDRRPRWSDIEARIASGEQLPPQSEWVGGAPWETLFGESGSMPDIPIGGPWGGTTAPDNTIKVNLQAGTFLKIVDGLHISGGLKVSAFADATQRVILYGYVLSHTA